MATHSGLGVKEVISHEEPTSFIHVPMFDTMVAIHSALKIGVARGVRGRACADSEAMGGHCQADYGHKPPNEADVGEKGVQVVGAFDAARMLPEPVPDHRRGECKPSQYYGGGYPPHVEYQHEAASKLDGNYKERHQGGRAQFCRAHFHGGTVKIQRLAQAAY